MRSSSRRADCPGLCTARIVRPGQPLGKHDEVFLPCHDFCSTRWRREPFASDVDEGKKRQLIIVPSWADDIVLFDFLLPNAVHAVEGKMLILHFFV